jgi:hypothetical protein
VQLRRLSDDFDDAELATVVRFLRGAAERQLQATRRLTGPHGTSGRVPEG